MTEIAEVFQRWPPSKMTFLKWPNFRQHKLDFKPIIERSFSFLLFYMIS